MPLVNAGPTSRSRVTRESNKDTFRNEKSSETNRKALIAFNEYGLVVNKENNNTDVPFLLSDYARLKLEKTKSINRIGEILVNMLESIANQK
ncbi:MAG: hypothetical protein N3E37_03470 [Candidatus Micrarchaeota archaeon]|nr:hypothetical protein [Candidatus Micrarchaeota archaeon]